TVPGATGYRVFGGAQGTTPPDTLVTTTLQNQTSTTISNLVAGTTYCYSVTATTATLESPRSVPICATISGATVVPSAPSTLRLQGPPGIDAVTLAWTNTSTNADGFYLYEGDNTVATIPGLVTSYTLTGWNGAVQH